MAPKQLLLTVILLISLTLGILFLAHRPAERLAIGHPGPGIPVRALLKAGLDPLLSAPAFRDVKAESQRLYDSYGWRALWWNGHAATPGARGMLARFAACDSLGLRPSDYDAARLDSAAKSLEQSGHSHSPADVARFDLALTVSAARFARALALGRVSPKEAGVYLRQPRPIYAPAAFLDSLRVADFQEIILQRIQPHTRQYRLLLGALARYRALAQDPGAAQNPMAPPLAERIAKIRLTLERARWLPRETRGPIVLVNIPSYRLHVLRSLDVPGDSILSMDVVVGKALDKHTPVFTDEITSVVFRPYWEVPVSIMEEEIRPKALADEHFLEKNRMVLLEGPDPDDKDASTKSPDKEVPGDKDNIERIGKGIRVRQLPGAENALGNIKFLLPNQFGVYLHDTPSQSGFDRTRRDFSHGCVRLEHPLDLARFLLRDEPQWTPERMQEAMNADLPEQANLKTPVTVYILYRTAEATEGGDVLFYPDVYQLDELLDRLLQGGYPYEK